MKTHQKLARMVNRVTLKNSQGGNGMAKKQKLEKLTIDYPNANEVIWGGHYAVRISVPQCEEVEISIDGGKWALCRYEAGHCWFDIHNLANGDHKLAVRMIKNGEGTVYSRKFIVSR